MKPIFKSTHIFGLVLALLWVWTGTNGLTAQKRVGDIKYSELHKINLPEIQKTEIANGMKLRLIKDDKLPLIHVRVLLKGGIAYDPSDKRGLSSMMAQLLRIGGTKDLSGDDMDKALDSKGITINIYATNDYFSLSMDCLTENIDAAMSLLARMLREPAFNQEKLEEIKVKAVSAISRRNEQPNGVMRREFLKLIYGENSPFANAQEYDDVKNISRDDVVKMYEQCITPDNMLVGVTGPLAMNQVRDLFDRHFGGWNTKANIPPFPEVTEQPHDFKVAFAERPNLNQSYFIIGQLGVKRDLAETAKFRVFNTIFSGDFSSRINMRIRVRMGLTYGAAGGIFPEYRYPGATYFTTYTKSESTIEAIKAMLDEINLIRKQKVTEKELNEAKNYYLNSYVFNFSSPERILFTSIYNEFYGIPQDFDKQLQEDIKKVTAEDVFGVAEKYLSPDKMIIVVVGNEKEIKGDLSELGKVKKLDISIKPPVSR
ncbi:MAG: M16 family metallopeptidase [Candidatus Omnitrophota bacterium]